MSKHVPISTGSININFNNLYRAGTFGVDSGTIWIGDPCYMIGYDEKKYDEQHDIYFDKTNYNKASLIHLKNEGANLTQSLGGKKAEQIPVPEVLMYHEFPDGLRISTLHGDGRYPVYVEMDGGSVRRIIIDFDNVVEPHDEDEYEIPEDDQ